MHPTAPRTIGQTGITLSPLVFGGNVFGWTADKAASLAMLDRLLSDPQGQLTPLRGSKLWQLAELHLWLDQQGL